MYAAMAKRQLVDGRSASLIGQPVTSTKASSHGFRGGHDELLRDADDALSWIIRRGGRMPVGPAEWRAGRPQSPECGG